MLTRISLNFCLEVEIALGSDPLLQRLVDPDGRVQLVQTDLKRSKVALIGSDLSISKILHRNKSQNLAHAVRRSGSFNTIAAAIVSR